VVTASPVAQTICDGGTTDILLETITVASQGVRFSYDIFAQDANITLVSGGSGTLQPGPTIMTVPGIVFDYTTSVTGGPGDVTGYIPSQNGLQNNFRLLQELTNNTNTPQYVTYHLVPRSTGTSCANGPTVNVVIRVNPNPYQGHDVDAPQCIGGYSGSVDLIPAEGSGPYTFAWSGPDGFTSDEEDLVDVISGVYTITITDANNCQHTRNIIIPTPGGIFASPPIRQNVSCFEGSDGHLIINVTASSTRLPLRYEWFGPTGFVFADNTQKDQFNLVAGEYYVIVTDALDCVYDLRTLVGQAALTISEPPLLEAFVEGIGTSCNINDDGKATVDVTGGTPPYSYFWTGPAGFPVNPTLKDQEGLRAGDYELRVTDANGCITFAYITIGELPPFIVTPVIVTNYNGWDVSCNGASDGSVILEIIGDYPPYQFQWSNGSTDQNLTNVPAGTYTVNVLDAVNCPASGEVTLFEPPEMNLDIFTLDVSCYGYEDGEISLVATGGTGTFFYDWANGQSSATLTGLVADSYPVRVVDLNNCYIDANIIITQPDPLEINPIIQSPYCDVTTEGQIILNTSGGTQPYTWLWSTGATTENITNISAGQYSVTIRDANDCLLDETLVVSPLNPLCITIPNTFTPNGDGFNDTWVIGSPEGGTLGQAYPYAVVEVFNRWGELVYRSDEGYSRPWNGMSDGKPLPMDSYYYIITLNNGQPPVSGIITIIR
jgi:gliding motility-associated-like protein